MVYLDHAAATPVDDRVLDAMAPYWQEYFHNPSALYTAARTVADHIRDFRGRSAHVLGVRQQEVHFAAGATEANNTVINGVMARFPEAGVVTSAIEHESILRPARSRGSVEVPVDAAGRIAADDVAAAVTEATVLISIEYVNSELGVVQPLRDIARRVADIRTWRHENGNPTPLYLHSDMSQAAGRLPMQLPSLGVDMATINGGKIYAPKQSGLLYIKRGVQLTPIITGGGQEHGVRSGTENVAFAAGITKALEIAADAQSRERERLRSLRDQLLEDLDVGKTAVNGSLRHRAPDNLNVSFPGVDGEMLVHTLDAHGVQAATGSACSATDDTPSHVLVALGCDTPRINGSLRLSLGRDTSPEDISYAARTIKSCLSKSRTG